jgi:hypothetical protein
VPSDPAPLRPAAPKVELHVCAECGSHLVQPVEWEPASNGAWEILLRCPECESWESGVFADDDCMRFDDVLDQGIDALVADLHTLAMANMEHDVERFLAALDADLILPEDF